MLNRSVLMPQRIINQTYIPIMSCQDYWDWQLAKGGGYLTKKLRMENVLKSSVVAGSKPIFTACSSVNMHLKSHLVMLPGRLTVLSKSPSPYCKWCFSGLFVWRWRPFRCRVCSSLHGRAHSPFLPVLGELSSKIALKPQRERSCRRCSDGITT